MIKKRKRGVMLILIGIALPLVLFFFQEEGEIILGSPIIKEIDRKLTPEEVEKIEEEMEMIKKELKGFEKFFGDRSQVLQWSLKYGVEEELKKEKWTIRTKAMRIMPYKYTIGIGIIIIFIGIGNVIFSFYPKESKKK